MISERVIAVGVEQMEQVHRPGMTPQIFVRHLIEAIMPALTRDLFAWVNRDSQPLVLFFDATVLDLDVLGGLFEVGPQQPGPLLVPVVPSSGKTVKDYVLEQKPAELRRLLYASNGERFIQSLSENPL